MKQLFLSVLLMLLPMLASAETIEYKGIRYSLDATTKEAAVISNSTKYSGSIKLPNYVYTSTAEYEVASIADNAFKDCTGLTSVTIPGGVKSIGDEAFIGCSGLTSVTMNTNMLKSIGISAFEGCSSMTSVTIPYSVKSIGNYAFYGCSGLISVHITDLKAWCGINFPSSSANPLTYAHRLYLKGEEVKDLEIPIGVTSIVNYAFYGCSGLTSVTIPNTVTSIGHMAFSGCSGLTSVSIPNNVTSIGNYAFEGCSGLKSVIIGKNVTSIGNSAFYSSSSLTSIVSLNSNPPSITSSVFNNVDKSKCVVWVPNGSLSPYQGANEWKDFANIKELPSGEILEYKGIWYSLDVTTKEAAVISNPMKYSGSIKIPNYVYTSTAEYEVTSIADEAFKDCSGLTSVTIPGGVKSIGNSAFLGCSGLASVNIGNSVTSIGNLAFYNCITLGSVNIPSSVKSIGIMAFCGCSSLTSVTISNGVTTIDALAFSGCSALATISIPSSVTGIGFNAFDACKGLSSVHISDLKAWCGINFGSSSANPLTYAHHLYLNGEEIKNLVIPSGVTSIGYYTFSGCSGLTSITIPNNVTSIGSSAFYGCSGLTSITIPNNVTSIGTGAFSGCSGLTSIKVESGNKKYDSRNNCNAIIETSSNTLIAGCKITTIPSSVTSIGNYAFSGHSGLTSITIPIGVTSIGNYAFYGCSGLTSITIPNSVASIGSSAFYGCSGLTSVTIPNSVASIGSYTFSGCSGLTSVTIGKNVTSVGNYAFNGCSSLTSIFSLNSNPPSCGSSVFDYVDKNNCVVWVPNGSLSAYSGTDGWKDFVNFKEIAEGDVNFDKKVNENDLKALVNFIMGKKPSGFYEILADLNGDAKVNAADVVLLINAIASNGLSTDSKFEFDISGDNSVVSSINCKLKNERSVAIQLTKCELYCNSKLVGYENFSGSSASVAAGGSKECLFTNLAKYSSSTGFALCWYYSAGGKNYVYRVAL